MNSLPAQQPQVIRERYERILEQIGGAALRVGRSPDSVRVVVVTKTKPIETLRAVLQAGITEIGENYAEEAVEKMSALGESPSLNWHMIGHVQSRKAGLVAKHFSLLHSLDSLKLATRLDRAALEENRILPVLIECNVSGEASKFGYSAWEKPHWAELLEQVQQIVRLPGLSLLGLMTMPPIATDAEQSRPYFQRLRALRDFLREQIPQATFDELSMGTSADFVCAVEEGATLVRIGTAIVGSRQGA